MRRNVIAEDPAVKLARMCGTIPPAVQARQPAKRSLFDRCLEQLSGGPKRYHGRENEVNPLKDKYGPADAADSDDSDLATLQSKWASLSADAKKRIMEILDSDQGEPQTKIESRLNDLLHGPAQRPVTAGMSSTVSGLRREIRALTERLAAGV
jgi:hypothetical protein